MVKMTLRKKRIHGCLYLGSFVVIAFFMVVNLLPRRPRFSQQKDVIFANDRVTVENTGSINTLSAGYILNEKIYALEDHFVYSGSGDAQPFSNMGYHSKISTDLKERVKDFVARLNIVRFFRKNIAENQIVVLRSGTILVFYDYIYRSTDGGHSFEPVFYFDKDDMSPFEHGVAVDNEDNVYFGEYDCTQRPHAIQVYVGYNDGVSWQGCYEFPAGDIFHIHNIEYDPFRDRLWICTGDHDDESRLMYTDDKFETIHTLGEGDQGWRIVSLIVEKDYLYWGSDNDRTGSFIYRYNFETSVREQLQFIGKPSYFSTKLADGTLVISTTYEPESFYTRDHDPEPTTDLWISKSGTDWIHIESLPHQSFQKISGESRASIKLPNGEFNAQFLFATPQNTTILDHSLQRYKIQWRD